MTRLTVAIVPLQVPSNIVIRRARPSVWLSLIMILWGAMMVSSETTFNEHVLTNRSKTLQGFVHNFSGLLGKSMFCFLFIEF